MDISKRRSGFFLLVFSLCFRNKTVASDLQIVQGVLVVFCVLEVSFVAGVGFGDFGGSRRTSAKFVPHSPSYRTERWKEILLEMEKDHKSSISWTDHEPIEDHILSWLHVEVEDLNSTILERFDSHPALVCLRVQAAKSQGRTHQIRVHMAHEAFVYSKLPAMSTEHGKSRNCNTSLAIYI